MFIRVFVVALTFATLWWSSNSFGLGLGLGELNVHSNLASPLKASVTLRGMGGIDGEANLVMVEEPTPDSQTNVKLDSDNSRILYFPESSTEDKNIDKFESEVKLTLQAIRDQLQNITERLFVQERETQELHKTISEMSGDSPKTGRKNEK